MSLVNQEFKQFDEELDQAMQNELNRQQNTIELIASENIVSDAVLHAQGSVLTNKYAEGYPNKRYYGGCQYVDKVEELAIERVKTLFNAKYANVQPHSGSQANFAVYFALLKPGESVLGLSLNSGGHLTHGSKVSFSGKWFNACTYDVDPDSEMLDYDEIRKIARSKKPKLIIAGYSAYSRIIDFKVLREISDEVGAYLLVDMAHIAGLIAGGAYPNPLPHAHVVTSTTHKTLRGPRGGIILTNNEDIYKKINSSIFPGIQGGPLMHVIAAKAVAFKEALTDDFKQYIKNVINNSKVMAKEFINNDIRVVSGGTDSHLLMLDLRKVKITGNIAEELLDSVNITCNKNSIPFDTESPKVTSGLRIGTPAITTRGMGIDEAKKIANIIIRVLKSYSANEFDDKAKQEIKSEVAALCNDFPIYKWRKH